MPPAAKQGDQIVATDTHIVTISGTPTPMPHPFTGIIDGALSSDVMIQNMPAATVDSTATNTPSHIAQGDSFVNPPKNQGRIIMGSATVMINNKPAARSGDTALTCNDPTDLPVGTVVAVSTVMVGG